MPAPARAVSPAPPPFDARAVIRELLGLIPLPALAAFTLQLLDRTLVPNGTLVSGQGEAPAAAPNGGAEAEQPAPQPVSASPRRRRGPDKRARRAGAARRRNGSKAEPVQDTEAAQQQPNGRARSTAALLEARKVGAALWRKASEADNGRPWAYVARRFGLNEALCMDARRTSTLPVGLSREQAAEFIGET